jgi:hypothetical protein
MSTTTTNLDLYKPDNGETDWGGDLKVNGNWDTLDANLPKSNFSASVAPDENDDTSADYAVGSRWFDTTNDKAYNCLDASAGAAVWKETTAQGEVTSVFGRTGVVAAMESDYDASEVDNDSGVGGIFVSNALNTLNSDKEDTFSKNTAFNKNFGSAADTVCEGDDSRLSDDRTPTAHATSHESGGSDAIKLDDLAAPENNTDLNTSVSAHGLCPILDDDTDHFLSGDGSWSAPSGEITAAASLTDNALIRGNGGSKGIQTSGVTVDDSGNVGIGKSSPESLLHLRGLNQSVSSGDALLTIFTADSVGINKGGSIRLGGSYTGSTGTAFGIIQGAKENATDANTAGYIKFLTRPNGGAVTERMRIDSSGNVGIGTESPRESAALHLVRSSAPSILTMETERPTIFFIETDGSANENYQIRLEGGKLRLQQQNDAGSNAYDKFAIDQSGNCGIGTTSPAASAKLEISSTTGALLVSRMTTTQRDALTAVNGMIIYNSTTNAFNFYENGAWVSGSGLA